MVDIGRCSSCGGARRRAGEGSGAGSDVSDSQQEEEPVPRPALRPALRRPRAPDRAPAAEAAAVAAAVTAGSTPYGTPRRGGAAAMARWAPHPQRGGKAAAPLPTDADDDTPRRRAAPQLVNVGRSPA
eukprot:gene12506-66994_t